MKRILSIFLVIILSLCCCSGAMISVEAAGEICVNGETEHTYVTVPGTAATYTDTGLTVGIQCSRCGEWLVDQEIIPMLTGGVICGDTDRDDEVTIFDVTLIRRKLVHCDVCEQFSEEAADVDDDGTLTIFDATYIQRYMVSIETKLPIGECISYPKRKQIDKNINFVGMSIWWYDGHTLDKDGFCGGVKATGYQTLLKEQFAFRYTQNFCYSGYSLGATSESDTYSIMENPAAGWTAREGDIWTLDTITNDFRRNIPIGTISDYTDDTGAETYYGALRKFEDKVTELSGSDAVVVCANALRRNNSGYTSTSVNKAGHTLADYEQALLAAADINGWRFVDQFDLSGITDDNLAVATLDGLHLNNYGYSLAVKPWIEQFDLLADQYGADEGEIFAEIISGSYVNTSGEFADSSSWSRTDYIEVESGKTYKYYGIVTLGGSVVSAVYGYNENKEPVFRIAGYNVDSADGSCFTVPDGVAYIICSSHNSATLNVTNADETGYVELLSDVASRYITSSGTTSSSSGWRMKGYTSPITVAEGDIYKYIGMTAAGSGASVVCVCGYDVNGDFVSVLVDNGDHPDGTTFTIPDGVAFIKCCSKTTVPELYKLIAE